MWLGSGGAGAERCEEDAVAVAEASAPEAERRGGSEGGERQWEIARRCQREVAKAGRHALRSRQRRRGRVRACGEVAAMGRGKVGWAPRDRGVLDLEG